MKIGPDDNLKSSLKLALDDPDTSQWDDRLMLVLAYADETRFGHVYADAGPSNYLRAMSDEDFIKRIITPMVKAMRQKLSQ